MNTRALSMLKRRGSRNCDPTWCPTQASCFWLTITVLASMHGIAYGATKEYSLVVSSGIVSPDSGKNRTVWLNEGGVCGNVLCGFGSRRCIRIHVFMMNCRLCL